MRLVLSSFAAASALALAACGGGEETQPADPAETAAPVAEPAAPEPQAEPQAEPQVETPAEPQAETPAAEPAEPVTEPQADAEPAPEPAPIEEAAASAGSADAQTILAAYGEPYLGADLGNGERLWRRCQSCHTVEAGARHMVGPNLHGVFGREIGTAEGFRYSSAVEAADFVWSPAQLEQWLANPREFLPGNRMSFAGLRDENDRHDLIAWLAVASHAE